MTGVEPQRALSDLQGPSPMSPSPWPRRVAIIAVGCTAVAIALAIVSSAVEPIVEFQGYPANGAFQLLNPLRRLAMGQFPGRDFQVFHGIGVPWLHYPIFRLAGATLGASELARHVVSPSAFLFGSWLFLTVMEVPSLLAAAIAMALWAFAGPLGLEPLRDPANSLTGVRSFFPIVGSSLAVVVIRRLGHASPPHWRFVLVGAVFCAASLACGTEHGVATILSFSATSLLLPFADERWRDRAWRTVALLGATAVAIVVLFALLTAWHPMSALRYALIDVPGDQFWYFGAPPSWFISEAREFLAMRWSPWRLLAGSILLLCLGAAIMRGRRMRAELIGCFTLLLSGAIAAGALLGMSGDVYTLSLWRAEILVSACLLVRVAGPVFTRQLHRALAIDGAVVATIVLTALALPSVSSATPARIAMLKALHRVTLTPALGVAPGPGWTSVLGAARDIAHAVPVSGKFRTWSTYTGIIDEEFECVNPAGDDYAIHALGRARRRAYAETFEAVRPDLVVTLRRVTYPWEEWLQTTTWEFYERLARSYAPRTTRGMETFWTRREGGELPVSPWQDLDATGLRVRLPAVTRPTLFTVELTYATTSRWSAIPILKHLPRHLVQVSNAYTQYPAPLPPAGPWRIPVFAKPGEAATLEISTHSLAPGASAHLMSARCRTVEIPETTFDELAGLTP